MLKNNQTEGSQSYYVGLSEFSNAFKIPPYTELGLSDSAQNMFIITCSSRLPKILKNITTTGLSWFAIFNKKLTLLL